MNSETPLTQALLKLSNLLANGEKELYLDIMEVPKDAGMENILLSKKYFKIDGKVIYPLKIEAINHACFDDFYKKALALKPEDGSDYITAFNVFWGLDETSKSIVAIYQPVTLVVKFPIPSSSPMNNDNIYKTYREGAYYRYDETKGFDPSISEKDFEKYTQMYVDHMAISQDATVFKLHNKGSDVYGDVKAQLFSFQEIFGLREANPKYEVILMYNSIRIIEDVAKLTLIKHTVLFGPKELEMEEFTDEIVTMPNFKPLTYADLAHLCPPNCSRSMTSVYPFKLR